MAINKKKRRYRKGSAKPRVTTPAPPRMVLSDYVLQKRVVALAECIRLYPDEVASGLAKRDEAGWCFGRLYLIGAIDVVQYSAAKRLDRTVRKYKRVLHRHGLVEAQDIERAMLAGSGSSGEDLSDQAIKASVGIYEEYKSAYKKLTEAGKPVRDALFVALERDYITDLGLVRHGLDVLTSSKK